MRYALIRARRGLSDFAFSEDIYCVLFLRLQDSFEGHWLEVEIEWFQIDLIHDCLNVMVCLKPANRLLLTVKATVSLPDKDLLIYRKNGC